MWHLLLNSFFTEAPPTSDLQLALHLVLSQLVDGPTRVAAAVKLTGLPDVERQHALFVLHQVLGVLADDHVVLHPDDFRLSVGWCAGGEKWVNISTRQIFEDSTG